MDNLSCGGNLVSDHVANLLWEVEGTLPGDKEDILQIIDHYLGLPDIERLRFRLRRRLLSYLQIYGSLTDELKPVIAEAQEVVEASSPEAANIVDRAIESLKQGFI